MCGSREGGVCTPGQTREKCRSLGSGSAKGATATSPTPSLERPSALALAARRHRK